MARQLAPQLAAHPTQSAFCLLQRGIDSMAARLALIKAAEHTVDAQYFVFANDRAGNLVVDQLLAAAERGVRVRLLVDDWYQVGQDQRLAGIAAHPNVEVRVFNPVGGPRALSFTRPLSFAFGPKRIRKRMHNKMLVVDNAAAVVGGRNISDDDFGLRAQHRDDDLDLLVQGPIVRKASMAFDEYWQDRLAIPIEAFQPKEHTAAHLEETNRTLDEKRAEARSSAYAMTLAESELLKLMRTNQLPLFWADAECLYDHPGKIVASEVENPSAYMWFRLKEIFHDVNSEALMISPYFVPSKHGEEWFSQIRSRGVSVKVLTNSLASTDEIAVHGAYAKYRPALIRDGVELYELRPDPGPDQSPAVRQENRVSKTMLHAKCVVLDRKVAFVGSFNLDSRSLWTDTQDGMVIRSPELAELLAAVFAKRIAPRFSYRVQSRGALNGTSDGKIVWLSDEDGTTVTKFSEPKASPLRRLKAWLLGRILPERWL